MKKPTRFRKVYFIVAIPLLLGLIGWLFRFYLDWQWFASLGHVENLTTPLLTDWALRLAGGVAAFLFVWLNLRLAGAPVQQAFQLIRSGLEEPRLFGLEHWVTEGRIGKLLLLISLFFGFVFSQSLMGKWLTLQQFLHPASFGIADPLFGVDLGFYFFQLPMWETLYDWLMSLLVLTLILLILLYQGTNLLAYGDWRWNRFPRAKYHLAALTTGFFLLKAVGYKLAMYDLLYSPRGVTFGASYTDVNAQLPALKILVVLSLLTAGAVLAAWLMRRLRLGLYGVGVLFGVSLIINFIYPALIQRFEVEPNEKLKERPYIEQNIKYTRQAFNLNNMDLKPFEFGENLTAKDIAKNPETIKNLRLWDWRPMQTVYGQLQAMRQYYTFPNVDIDRYTVDGEYRQVMLSAREMDQEKLRQTSNTWQNMRLLYTHGYGVVMSPVNEATSDGLPVYWLKDIPPKAEKTAVEVKRPEIYFGESTNEHVIVGGTSQEFDYPSGSENVYSRYAGTGGIAIDSFGKKLMVAAVTGDLKLLLSEEVTPNSRLLWNRNIKTMVETLTPFLDFDPDPYLVVHEGRLLWILDGYVKSELYPYSEPIDGFNYIRNPVKVVIDAYNGSATYYLVEPEEPMAKSLSGIFPGLFTPFEQMPEGLKAHLRYPEQMFLAQARSYATYHMVDPDVFYNKEDLWAFPQTQVDGRSENMEPYYTVMKLPGETKPEFVLMMPFTPVNKENMISWLAARSDGEHYGKVLAYHFPKQETVYGPSLIEARINQDATISQNLNLWSQRNSSVIRGNLLVIPIQNSLLYMQPLFLQSGQGGLPALRRVILVYGERVVMEETLDIALQKIFGEGKTPPTPQAPSQPQTTPQPGTQEPVSDLAKQAKTLYDEAQEKVKQGDWKGYGEKMQELGKVIEQMAQ